MSAENHTVDRTVISVKIYQKLRIILGLFASNELIKNYGAVKGRTFERVLPLSNGPMENLLKGKRIGSPAKYCVALTRSKYSTAICYDGDIGVHGIEEWPA